MLFENEKKSDYLPDYNAVVLQPHLPLKCLLYIIVLSPWSLKCTHKNGHLKLLKSQNLDSHFVASLDGSHI